MRADARRNRELIVETARSVFRAQGYDAPLDLIAKQAGVGPGTLYRHFPTREDLIDAVMQQWVERVEETTEKVLAFEGAPRDLLVTWLVTYAELISVHRGGPAKITTAMSDPQSPITPKCNVLLGATERVRERLSDDLKPGVDAKQMCQLVGGVATVADSSGQTVAQIEPLLEVLADGLLRQ